MSTMRLVLTLILVTHTGLSLPRFAVRTNLTCQNCHIDPNGGGMRTYYGSALYARGTLPVRGWNDSLALENFTTELSDIVSFGTDLRTLFSYRPETHTNSFYQMQGNIYLSAKLAKKVMVYLNKGLYSGFEVFGLLNILPANGYFKVGRFTPAYGTKTDDHTNFIRSKTDFINNRREDTGIEVGFSPSFMTWNVGLYNGIKGSAFSNEKMRLITSRLDMKFHVDNIKFSLGGSFWYNNLRGGPLTMVGGFGGMSFEKLTLHGEIDFKKDKSLMGTNEFISFIEVNYLLIDGVDLKLMYDFYDSDTGVKTGSETRYCIGLEFFPINGVEVRPMYRFLIEEPVDRSNNEIDILVHFYL